MAPTPDTTDTALDIEPPAWVVATHWLGILTMTVLVTLAVTAVGAIVIGPAMG